MPDIRLLTPNDAETYCALRREMIVGEPWSFMGVPGDDMPSEPYKVRKLLAHADNDIAGAFEADRLVATAGVYRQPHVKARHRANIWGVYTHPDFRRQGLARAVTQLALDTALAWPGVETIGISVSARDEGLAPLRLYESMGIRALGPRARRDPHRRRARLRGVSVSKERPPGTRH